ncbi:MULTISPECIES: TonB-dependent receptor [Massilia]|uniref:TonB-dependent receptor n=1 Tax=Massilia aurea TaxID=373040 RepID=A0A422QF59_9BURK|nr:MULTISPECIES: TonB-dependent receptor [Massilia]MDY0960997.1 TonB-dependent receptor [Massilia sp. CFBP9026]RNF28486.1 TonB-dependent receptor [Massilia aurea]
MNTLRFTPTPAALAAALLIATTASSTAFAQQAEPKTDENITTVVVTASADASAQGLPAAYAGGQVARGGRLGLLGNVDIMDTPFNSTNYTHALIQDQQARSVADVVQNDPSVRVARGFGNYQELYMIRGFAVGSDDTAYNGLYGLLPRQFVATELMERVEVLRGAHSFINGAAPAGGSIGGSINILPKRAPNQELSEVTVGVETGGQGYGAIDLGRRFGEEGRAGVRVNVAHRNGDTAVDREERELSVYSIGVDYRGRGYRLSADVGAQDHQLTNARPSVDLAAGLPMIAAPEAGRNFAQPWTVSNERHTFGTVRAEVDLGANAVAWAAAGLRNGQEFNILSSIDVNAVNGDATMGRFDNIRKDQVRTGEVGVRGSLRTGFVKHVLSASASGFHSKSRNAYAMGANFASNLYSPRDAAAPSPTAFVGGDMDSPLVTSKTILSGLAVADTMSFMDDKVLVNVGLRHQRIKDFGYDYNTGLENSGYESSKNTPFAAIVYKPRKDLSVYANYSEGLQRGPVASGTDIVNQGEIFAPYVARQREAGVKYDSGRYGLTAAVFTTSQPSAYVQDRVFGVFGEQRNRGLELSVFGNPVRGLKLLGGLTLIDAEQRITIGGINQGKDAIGVPETQLNIGADWDVPGVDGLSVNARTVYTSKQYADGANLQKLPSWTRLDLGATYNTRFMDRDLTLRARVDNVTDKNYWASAGGYPGAGYLVLAAPRSVVLSATVGF